MWNFLIDIFSSEIVNKIDGKNYSIDELNSKKIRQIATDIIERERDLILSIKELKITMVENEQGNYIPKIEEKILYTIENKPEYIDGESLFNDYGKIVLGGWL